MLKKNWIEAQLWGYNMNFTSIYWIKIITNKKFFKKFLLTYTGRIYKIFFKKKFIKMNFNKSHKLIFRYNFNKFFFKIIPFDKKIYCWLEVNNGCFSRIISKWLKIRPLNMYTWRGLHFSRNHWTKKPGKISEYV